VCPECGKKALHKVYTPVGIVFKGSGFYATDHRSPSGQNKTKSSHEEKSSTSGTSESASDVSSSKKSSESSVEKSTSSTTPNPN
jgi:predicted nucleic acid-binding Zn ribbon protein